jgi:hypothetical protein
MAETKITALVVPLLFLVFSGGALSFNVEIDDMTSFSAKDVNLPQEKSAYQSINASIENTGSIGCRYRLKVDYNYSGESFERFSPSYPIWPGESERARIDLLVRNYTGNVEGDLSVNYCGQEEKVTDFNFTSENLTLEKEHSSTTISANSSNTQIRVHEVEKGRLVPVKAPSYWKTSSTELENGKAVLEYEAPIFQPEETITYAIVQNSSSEGFVKVGLDAEESLWDRVLNYRNELLYSLIVLLAALNIFQYLRGRKPEN